MLIGAIIGVITGWILSNFGFSAWFFSVFQFDFPFEVTMIFYYAVFAAIGVIIGYFQSSGANGFGVGVGPTVSAQRIIGLSNGPTGQFLSTCIIVNKGELYSFDLTNVTATFYPFKNQLQE